MQTVCTSLQTVNHVNTSSLNVLQTTCSSWRPTNSVRALKANYRTSYYRTLSFLFFLVFLFPVSISWLCALKLTRVSFWAHVETAYLVIWCHCQYSTIPLLMDHLWHLVLVLDSKLSALTGRGDCWLTEDKLYIRLYCSWNKLSNRQTDQLIAITSSPVGAE